MGGIRKVQRNSKTPVEYKIPAQYKKYCGIQNTNGMQKIQPNSNEQRSTKTTAEFKTPAECKKHSGIQKSNEYQNWNGIQQMLIEFYTVSMFVKESFITSVGPGLGGPVGPSQLTGWARLG